MAAPVELARKFEVMEDTKDSLDDSHERLEREAPALIVTNRKKRPFA